MAEYIKREDILAKKQTIYFEYFDSDSGYVEEEGDLAVTVEDILKIPAADVVERKRGKWIHGIDEETGEQDLYAWTCSLCGEKYPWQPNYCPNCGADMRGEDDEES